MITTPTVQKGPSWLAGLMINPPWWVPPLLSLLAILVILGGIWGYRRYGIDADTKYRMLENGLIIVCVGALAIVLRPTPIPYLGVVAIAFAVGYMAATRVLTPNIWQNIAQ